MAEFEKNNVPYAVIGGFALGALGVPRSTIDLDFLVPSDALGKEVKVKVLRAEDIIGLKLQAISNNPDRLAKDNADIEELMKSRKLDWERLKTYFELFDMGGRFTELRGKYGGK